MIVHKVRIKVDTQIQRITSGSFLKPLKVDRQDELLTLWYLTNCSEDNNSSHYYLLKVWTGVSFYLGPLAQYAGSYEDGLVHHLFLIEDNDQIREMFTALGGKE